MALPTEIVTHGGLLLALPAILGLVLYIWHRTISELDKFHSYIDNRSAAMMADSHERRVEFATRLAAIEQAQVDMIRRDQQVQQQWIRAYDETQRQMQTLIVRIDRLLERN